VRKARQASEHASEESSSEWEQNVQLFTSPLMMDTSSQSSLASSRKPVENHSSENWELRT
jgi:hypothetical protein